MMSCPSYHESFFPTRQRTGDPRDWRDAVYAFLTLMVRMKVSEMVALANLHEHPDNDTAGWRSQAFRHEGSLVVPKMWQSCVVNRPRLRTPTSGLAVAIRPIRLSMASL